MRARLSDDGSGPLTGAPKPNCICCSSSGKWLLRTTVAGPKRRGHLGLAIGLATQPIVKSPYFGSFQRSRCGDDVVGEWVRQRQGEQAHEPTGGEVGGGDRILGEHYPVTRNRRVQRQVHVVKTETGDARDVFNASGFQPHRPSRRQWVALDRLIVDQSVC